MANFRIISNPDSIFSAISNSGVIEVTTETPSDTVSYYQWLESQGYRKLYYTSSTNTFTYSNVVDGAADMAGVQEYGLSAVNTETYVDAQTTKNMLRVGGLAADAGLNILDGGVTAGVGAAQFGAAVSLGAGIGLRSAEAYPAFWNALGDGLVDGIGGQEVMPVIMRAVEGGGIRNYARKQDIDTALDNLYDLTALESDITDAPDKPTTSGTYSWSSSGTDDGNVYATYDKMLKTGSDERTVLSTNEIRRVITAAWNEYNDNYPDGPLPNFLNTQSSYAYGTSYMYDTTVTVGVGYKEPGPIDVSTSGPFMQALLRGVQYASATGRWNRSSFDEMTTSHSNQANPIVGTFAERSGGYITARGSSIYTSLQTPDPAVIEDPQSVKAPTRASFWDTFADWLNDGFETTDYDPETDTNKKTKWLPLNIPVIHPNEDVQPDQDTAQEGDQPNPDPVINPLKIVLPFIPTITIPSLPDYPTPEPTPPTSAIDSSGSALWAVYNPTKTEINDLGSYLWTQNIIDVIEQFFKNSPLDAIISLHMIYCTPTTGAAQHIYLGYLDSGVSADVVTNQYEEIDCGTVFIPEHFGDVRDYSDTTIDVYLPFIGIRTLNTADCVNSYINIKYTVDVLTGTTLAQIFITKTGITQCLYQYEGNCSVQIPLTAADRTRLVSGMVGALSSAVAGGAAGGPMGAVGGAVSGAVRGFANSSTINRTGGLSGNSGAMAIKTPYILITRKKPNNMGDYNITMGGSAAYTVTLGQCSGFTVIRKARVDLIPGITSDEFTELESILSRGIII